MTRVISNTMFSLWECFTNIHPGEIYSEEGKKYPSRPNIWRAPEHQRERAWDEKAIKDYYADLIKFYNEGGGQMTGTIQVYNYKGEDVIYVNDGLQRTFFSIKQICESLRFQNKFKKMFDQGKSKDFKDMMQEIKLEVQRVEYENIEQAISGFVGANKGTITTPFELGKTVFCQELSEFSSFWQHRLNRIHEIVKKAVLDVGCKKSKAQKRIREHKEKRDNLSIFLKFISKDKTTKSYRVAEPIYKDKNSLALESSLTKILKEFDHEEFDKKLDQFENMVENATQFYNQIFEEVVGKRIIPAEVNFRWWLIAKIHLSNLGVPVSRIKDFTEKFLKNNKGRSAFFYDDKNGKQNNTNCAMSNISKITHLARLIGFDLQESTPEKRKKASFIRKGFHASHEKSFSENGENTVRVENALENLARNNKDMTEEEKNRCPVLWTK